MLMYKIHIYTFLQHLQKYRNTQNVKVFIIFIYNFIIIFLFFVELQNVYGLLLCTNNVLFGFSANLKFCLQ